MITSHYYPDDSDKCMGTKRKGESEETPKKSNTSDQKSLLEEDISSIRQLFKDLMPSRVELYSLCEYLLDKNVCNVWETFNKVDDLLNYCNSPQRDVVEYALGDGKFKDISFWQSQASLIEARSGLNKILQIISNLSDSPLHNAMIDLMKQVRIFFRVCFFRVHLTSKYRIHHHELTIYVSHYVRTEAQHRISRAIQDFPSQDEFISQMIVSKVMYMIGPDSIVLKRVFSHDNEWLDPDSGPITFQIPGSLVEGIQVQKCNVIDYTQYNHPNTEAACAEFSIGKFLFVSLTAPTPPPTVTPHDGLIDSLRMECASADPDHLHNVQWFPMLRTDGPKTMYKEIGTQYWNVLGGGDNLRVVTNNGHIRKLKNYKMRVNGKFSKGSKQCTGAEDKWSNSFTGQGRDKVIPYSTWPVWLREHSEYMNCQFVPAKTDDKMVCDVCLHSFLSNFSSNHTFLQL